MSCSKSKKWFDHFWKCHRCVKLRNVRSGSAIVRSAVSHAASRLPGRASIWPLCWRHLDEASTLCWNQVFHCGTNTMCHSRLHLYHTCMNMCWWFKYQHLDIVVVGICLRCTCLLTWISSLKHVYRGTCAHGHATRAIAACKMWGKFTWHVVHSQDMVHARIGMQRESLLCAKYVECNCNHMLHIEFHSPNVFCPTPSSPGRPSQMVEIPCVTLLSVRDGKESVLSFSRMSEIAISATCTNFVDFSSGQCVTGPTWFQCCM